MNYAQARELADGSGWRFTVRNDRKIWTHPCCRQQGSPATQEDVSNYGYRLGEATLGEPHAPHATREEAEACFQRWRIGQAEQWRQGLLANWDGCVVCDTPTKTTAIWRDIGGASHIALCEQHLRTDIVVGHVERNPITHATYS